MTESPATPATAVGRRALIAGVALALPIIAAAGLAATPAGPNESRNLFATAPFLAAVGILSWVLGLRWYGPTGLGLRGKRPLFAGIGFAVLGWVAVLLTRIVAVSNTGIANIGLGRAFIFVLLFEAFCLHLWLFGLVFRAVGDWRGALSGVFVGGVLFGLAGLLLFGEAAALREAPVATQLMGVAYFLLWGFLYGLIRLRTGSVLGPIFVHALQSATTWYLFLPLNPAPAALRWTYGVAGLLYLVIIWRLWPHVADDYRV